MSTLPRPTATQRLAGAARDLLGHQSGDVYRAAGELALANVAGATAAGLSLVRRGRGRDGGSRIEIRGATSEAVKVVGRLQDETGEGPCLEAVWEEPVVHSRDLADEPRFPVWARRVVEETGLRSALSIRLFTHDDTLGALCVYSTEPRAFDASSIEDASALAAHVAVAIADAENIAHLKTALDTRALVGQATGILIERYQMTAASAFSLLTRVASAEEVKVRALAAELVETGRLRGVPDPLD